MNKCLPHRFTRISAVNPGCLLERRFHVANATRFLAAMLATSVAPCANSDAVQSPMPPPTQQPLQFTPCGDDFKPGEGSGLGFSAQLAKVADNARHLDQSSILDPNTLRTAKRIVADVIAKSMVSSGQQGVGNAGRAQGSDQARKEQGAPQASGADTVQGTLNDRSAVFNQIMEGLDRAGIGDEKIDAIMLTLSEGLP